MSISGQAAGRWPAFDRARSRGKSKLGDASGFRMLKIFLDRRKEVVCCRAKVGGDEGVAQTAHAVMSASTRQVQLALSRVRLVTVTEDPSSSKNGTQRTPYMVLLLSFRRYLYLKRTMFLIRLTKLPNRVLSGASASSLSKSV